MVKQPDGTFMAPEAVLQNIRDTVAEFNDLRTSRDVKEWKSRAQWYFGGHNIWAERFFIGDMRKLALEAPSPQVHLIVTDTLRPIDIRAFSADGLTAYLLIDFKPVLWVVYSTSDWTLIDPALPSKVDSQLWRIRFDLTDGRWKYEELVATPKR